MSNLDISLYEEIIEGLTYNRELEIYYNDYTYGIVTYEEYGNYGKIKSFWLNVMIFCLYQKIH